MVDYTASTFWFFFLLTTVSLLVLRGREPQVRRPFRVPFYPLTPILYGRIPVTAAQKYSTRGVGIDINPQRIREANENAQNAGVTDRVQFRQEDLFETDFREATVVTLYLLPELNVKLRPRLLQGRC
jgi:Putative RNA methylase family UPF0020